MRVGSSSSVVRGECGAEVATTTFCAGEVGVVPELSPPSPRCLQYRAERHAAHVSDAQAPPTHA